MTNSTHSGLRRGLCLLLAFVMLVSCTGLTAFADDGILLEEETADQLPSPEERVIAEDTADEELLIEEALPASAVEDTEGTDAAAADSGDPLPVPEAPEETSETAWADLQEAINEAQSGDTITLTQDVLAQAEDSHLFIDNKDITIDLKGFSIDRGLT